MATLEDRYNHLAGALSSIQQMQERIIAIDAKLLKCADNSMRQALHREEKASFIRLLESKKHVVAFLKGDIKLKEYDLAFRAGPWC